MFEPLGMVDTGFHVPADKAHRFCRLLLGGRQGGKVLQDDPEKSVYLKPPSFFSGGGGLVSTAAGLPEVLPHAARRRRARRCTVAVAEDPGADGDEPSARRPRRLPELSRSLFSEATYDWRRLRPRLCRHHGSGAHVIPGSVGEFWWGGAATTSFLDRSGRGSRRRVHDRRSCRRPPIRFAANCARWSTRRSPRATSESKVDLDPHGEEERSSVSNHEAEAQRHGPHPSRRLLRKLLRMRFESPFSRATPPARG